MLIQLVLVVETFVVTERALRVELLLVRMDFVKVEEFLFKK